MTWPQKGSWRACGRQYKLQRKICHICSVEYSALYLKKHLERCVLKKYRAKETNNNNNSNEKSQIIVKIFKKRIKNFESVIEDLNLARNKPSNGPTWNLRKRAQTPGFYCESKMSVEEEEEEEDEEKVEEIQEQKQEKLEENNEKNVKEETQGNLKLQIISITCFRCYSNLNISNHCAHICHNPLKIEENDVSQPEYKRPPVNLALELKKAIQSCIHEETRKKRIALLESKRRKLRLIAKIILKYKAVKRKLYYNTKLCRRSCPFLDYFVCDRKNCQEIFATRQDLQDHEFFCHVGKLTCPFLNCGQVVRASEMKLHVRFEHILIPKLQQPMPLLGTVLS